VRFAFITPRYGPEIVAGGEHVCRMLAEQVCERHDVDVLTTCARDDETWKNSYPEGADRVRGVLVRRFMATGGREPEALRSLTERLDTSAHSRGDELEWVRRTGSSSPGLVEHLKRHQKNYDALVFFSYRAGTTIHGLAVAPERSVLFPCAQVEPALRLWVARETLDTPAAIGYVSTSERRLVRAHAPHRPRAEEVVGVGIDSAPESRYPRLHPAEPPPGEGEHERAEDETPDNAPPEDAPSHLSGRGVLFRRRHRLPDRFAFYGGRVDSDNGTEELLEYFAGYAEQNGAAAQPASLVVMGVKMMKTPAEPWLQLAGVLLERDRMAALEAADVSIAPDPDDIAAEHVLESFAVGTPVLASARNLAAVEHCRRANAGLYYANRDEFVGALRAMMTNTRLREALGRNGRRYVQQHYRWDAVLARFERLIARVKSR